MKFGFKRIEGISEQRCLDNGYLSGYLLVGRKHNLLRVTSHLVLETLIGRGFPFTALHGVFWQCKSGQKGDMRVKACGDNFRQTNTLIIHLVVLERKYGTTHVYF